MNIWQVFILFGKISDNIYLDNMQMKMKSQEATTAIWEIDQNPIFHPNPVDNYMIIPDHLLNASKISIYSLSGKLVKSFFASSQRIDLRSIENGTYILTTEFERKKYSQKLIVMH